VAVQDPVVEEFDPTVVTIKTQIQAPFSILHLEICKRKPPIQHTKF